MIKVALASSSLEEVVGLRDWLMDHFEVELNSPSRHEGLHTLVMAVKLKPKPKPEPKPYLRPAGRPRLPRTTLTDENRQEITEIRSLIKKLTNIDLEQPVTRSPNRFRVRASKAAFYLLMFKLELDDRTCSEVLGYGTSTSAYNTRKWLMSHGIGRGIDIKRAIPLKTILKKVLADIDRYM